MSENAVSLVLCYITDILDIIILLANIFVLSISVKLYSEVLKIQAIQGTLRETRGK